MMRHTWPRGLAAALLLGLAAATEAHFIFLVPQADTAGRTTVQVYFGETAAPDDPELLQKVTELRAWELRQGSAPAILEPQRTPGALQLTAGPEAESAVFIAADDYGVISRGGKPFKLMYYAKTGPAIDHVAWESIDSSSQLKLDVQPSHRDGKLHLLVRFNGQPVAKAAVNVTGGLLADELTTDAEGRASIAIEKSDLYSIRAKHVEAAGGKENDVEYGETRHYSTVAVQIPGASAATPAPMTAAAAKSEGVEQLAPLATCVTSFGGAALDGALYIYGGHSGGAHSYSFSEQGDTLLRLSLDGKGRWESLAKGPALQGLALVAHGDKLYRIGGFTAKNEAGKDHDLWSQNCVASFDPSSGAWTDLPTLPEPRSSFDAAVVGDEVYVVGGWQLRGKDDSIWHPTAWKLNLAQAGAAWEPIPSPPFRRRALAVAEFQGKLYAIGGMQEEGGPSKQVDIFDPKTGAWTQGPEILGDKPLAGFGAAAFACGDRLYVSTSEGKLQRLSADGTAWEVVQELPTARFFHRMCPIGGDRFVIVGGANMGSGKFDAVEVIPVAAAAAPVRDTAK